MRVIGEAYLGVNLLMNLLSLYMAGRVMRTPVRLGRAFVSALAGAVYAVTAKEKAGWLAAVPSQLLALSVMAAIAFSGRGYKLVFPVGMSGMLLAGITEYGLKRGIMPWIILCMNCAAVWILCRMLPNAGSRGGETLVLRFVYGGKTLSVPAFRDSGNLLVSPVTHLPVIILPVRMAKDLIPAGTNIRDLSTLPSGWTLIRAGTIAGEKTLMCFQPRFVCLQRKGKARPIKAVMAVSDFPEKKALLPDSLFFQEDKHDADR